MKLEVIKSIGDEKSGIVTLDDVSVLPNLKGGHTHLAIST